MSEDVQSLLQSAVVKVKTKVMPHAMTPPTTTHTQAPPHEVLYPLLEIWDNGRKNEGTQQQTQYIFDFLDAAKGDKTIKDMVIGVLTKIGATPIGETRIDRVWKYCKLRKRSRSIMGEYNQVQRDIDALSNR